MHAYIFHTNIGSIHQDDPKAIANISKFSIVLNIHTNKLYIKILTVNYIMNLSKKFCIGTRLLIDNLINILYKISRVSYLIKTLYTGNNQNLGKLRLFIFTFKGILLIAN